MTWRYRLAGFLALFTSLVHLLPGGREIARPLLSANLAEEAKFTLYACWHMVTIQLFLSAAALLMAAYERLQLPPVMLAFISSCWLLYGLLFLVLTLAKITPPGLFRLPQWALLLPVGLLGLWGAAQG
jgi:hypothetical protein